MFNIAFKQDLKRREREIFELKTNLTKMDKLVRENENFTQEIEMKA